MSGEQLRKRDQRQQQQQQSVMEICWLLQLGEGDGGPAAEDGDSHRPQPDADAGDCRQSGRPCAYQGQLQA